MPLLLGLTGCRQLLGFEDVASGDDVVVDAPGDQGTVSDATLCFGTFQPICLQQLPTASIVIGSNTTILTDVAASCDIITIGPSIEACVITATSFEIDATLFARGNRALVLIATDDASPDGAAIQISGVLDASSDNEGTLAAGGRSCPASSASASGGGAGGSFGGVGGAGGGGNNGPPTLPKQGIGTLDQLVGGCQGGSGGGGGIVGVGGLGGGAILLVASTIRISGRVSANGAGGQGGQSDQSGGGGGGSGGSIVFDAPSTVIESTGQLMAQGGGGGAGSAGAGGQGSPGSDPVMVDSPASGGIASDTTAGAGGAGATGGSGQTGGTAQKGGGGGGGGTGLVRFAGTLKLDGISVPDPKPL